jgi:glucan phosphoethanolaminetransferase (alkaline phosphatase superfamily)
MFEPYIEIVGFMLFSVGLYLFVFGHANTPRLNFMSSFPIIFMLLAINFYECFTAQKQRKWADWVMILWLAGITFEASLFLSIFKKVGI